MRSKDYAYNCVDMLEIFSGASVEVVTSEVTTIALSGVCAIAMEDVMSEVIVVALFGVYVILGCAALPM
ncbi:hypothetical protein Nepgr_025215 [Nepenthes gracilis]|uniref:Uncharacterized protein n=1 Tax=Nepenthes gracilis TaxID=150966 RepID=A0AAD3T7C8_NEPGR|nr:hypothetical protein Nepgr_025215 [Nepenthes gracilis]